MVRKVALSLMGRNGRAFSAGQSFKGTWVQIIAPAMLWISVVVSTMLKHEHPPHLTLIFRLVSSILCLCQMK